jgi:hypothetical protein
MIISEKRISSDARLSHSAGVPQARGEKERQTDMTYHRNQRMEAFKRAMFAGILKESSPIGRLVKAADSIREEQAPVLAPMPWRAGSAASGLVH